MQKFKNIVVVTGTYTNKTGEEKKRYQTIGTVFLDKDDNLKLKIDTIPLVEGGWSGWANCYDIEEKQEKKPRFDDNPSDIPF